MAFSSGTVRGFQSYNWGVNESFGMSNVDEYKPRDQEDKPLDLAAPQH